MNRYCGNNKPYIYVYFPEEKKEQALSVLEKLNASEEGSKINFWYSDANTLNKKETKRVEAAHALLAFADSSSPDVARFKETVNTVAGKNRNVMCVHLDELKYDTPWTKTQLGPQQAIKTRDYTDEASLAEKLKTAEIFRDMRVTKEQKRAKLTQLISPVAAMLAVALCVFGYLYFATDVFVPRTEAPDIAIDFDPNEIYRITGIRGTQEELAKVTSLGIVGENAQEEWDAEQGFSMGDMYVPKSGDLGTYDSDRSTYDTIHFYNTTNSSANLINTLEESCGKLSDLSFLQFFPNLLSLSIQGDEITDITPVLQLKKLKSLVLRCNKITSVEGIDALRELTDVDLAFNNIKDASPLFKCPDLHQVDLSYNTNLTELGNTDAPNIYSLNLCNTKVTRVPKIGVGKFVYFNGADCPIEDYSFLSEANSFTCLYVSGPVKETLLPAINGKTAENFLWSGSDVVTMNEIADTGFSLSKGTKRGTFGVVYSDIEDLDGIERIDGVKTLNLYMDPKITDLAPILKMSDFRKLGVSSELVEKAEDMGLRYKYNDAPYGLFTDYYLDYPMGAFYNPTVQTADEQCSYEIE